MSTRTEGFRLGALLAAVALGALALFAGYRALAALPLQNSEQNAISLDTGNGTPSPEASASTTPPASQEPPSGPTAGSQEQTTGEPAPAPAPGQPVVIAPAPPVDLDDDDDADDSNEADDEDD